MDIFNAGTSFFFPHMMGVMEIEMMFYLKLLSFIKKNAPVTQSSSYCMH
jgi:hypothetical protein